MPSLSDLTSEALTARLVELRSDERRILVEFLRHLAELDRRELYLELGHSSLFAFCTDQLRLTRSAAYRRTAACRLLATLGRLAMPAAAGFCVVASAAPRGMEARVAPVEVSSSATDGAASRPRATSVSSATLAAGRFSAMASAARRAMAARATTAAGRFSVMASAAPAGTAWAAARAAASGSATTSAACRRPGTRLPPRSERSDSRQAASRPGPRSASRCRP